MFRKKKGWRCRKRPIKATTRWHVWVAAEVFFIATEFSGSVSRQDLVLDRCSLVAVVVAPCRDRGFLVVIETLAIRGQGCDRLGLGRGFLGRNITFLVTTENRQD